MFAPSAPPVASMALLNAPLQARAAAGYLLSLSMATWMYATARRARPGWARLAWSLPVIACGLFVTPTLVRFEEALLIIPVAGTYHVMVFKVRRRAPAVPQICSSALAPAAHWGPRRAHLRLGWPVPDTAIPMQVIAFAMARGPMEVVQYSSRLHWPAVMCMPIIPAAGAQDGWMDGVLCMHAYTHACMHACMLRTCGEGSAHSDAVPHECCPLQRALPGFSFSLPF
jgi:hypothetical protein